MDLEQLLRQEFRARTAALPHPAGLAERAMAGATGVRRRRAMMITSAAVVVAVMALAVGLLQAPQPNPIDPAGVPDELSGLPVGVPPGLAVYGTHTLRLRDGEEIPINKVGADTVRHVERAVTGWVVVTPREGGLDTLRVTNDDGVVVFGADRVASWAVSRDRSRLAVHTRNPENRVDVYDVTAGLLVAGTALPVEPRGGPVVSGWTGSMVVLTGSSANSDGMTTDVWDPARGPYRATPLVERNMLGAAAEPGQLLGYARGTEEVCLERLDATAGFAATARWCGLGLRYGEALPWLSPDGSEFVVWHHQLGAELVAVDLRTSQRTTLPLPAGVNPIGVWWEGAETVLVRVNPTGEPPAWDRMSLVRCRLDGSSCERAPAPRVDGAEPIGVAPG